MAIINDTLPGPMPLGAGETMPAGLPMTLPVFQYTVTQTRWKMQGYYQPTNEWEVWFSYGTPNPVAPSGRTMTVVSSTIAPAYTSD